MPYKTLNYFLRVDLVISKYIYRQCGEGKFSSIIILVSAFEQPNIEKVLEHLCYMNLHLSSFLKTLILFKFNDSNN